MATTKSSPKEMTDLTVSGESSLKGTSAHIKTLGVNSDYSGSATDTITITREAFELTGGDPFMFTIFKFTTDGVGTVDIKLNGTGIGSGTIIASKVYVVETNMWRDSISLEMKAVTKLINTSDGSYDILIGSLTQAQTADLYVSSFDVQLACSDLNDAAEHFGAVVFG